MNKHKGSSFQDYMDEQPPDGNIHVVPTHGPKHSESEYCWCEPELIEDDTNNDGKKCYSHKEQQ